MLSERVYNAIANEGPRTNNAETIAAEVRKLGFWNGVYRMLRNAHKSHRRALLDRNHRLEEDVSSLTKAHIGLEERNRKLEAVEALAQHEDYGIDHAYFCNSTHDTGLPCDCELGPALADLEDGK